MKQPYFIAFLFSAILCVTSCSQEEILEPQNDKASFTIVGEPVRAHLSIAVSGLYFGVNTRAEEPVPDYDGEDSEDERHVDDLWLFEYSQSTGELIYSPQRVNIGNQAELADIEVSLSNNHGKPVTIYVVANSGSGVSENSTNWVVEEIVGNDVYYPGFMTIKELEANTIPTPHPQRMTLVDGKYVLDSQDAGAVSIPMAGHIETTVKDGAELLVPVARMFAKLLVRVDLSDFNKEDYKDAWLGTVTVGNIPEYCTVGALGSSTTVVPADYSTCPRWLRRSFNSVGESADAGSGGFSGGADEAVYPYLIYVPENIQGENRADGYDGSGGKADNLPNAYALSVAAGIYVETNSGATLGEYSSFVAYPGGNSTDNFNVRRNCLYRVTLKINNLIDDVLPSANCIVCLSGETTAFFPYCRTETGGGYKFTDYINAFSDDEDKRIARVEIIWQSRDNQGSSGTGYIGNNSSGNLVWIDEVGTDAVDEYHRRIHVKIPSGKTGNALIGAYNSNGDIIWSWHIWSRARENDPTTINTKLYYTYDWDENGIYGKDSGRPRVAGYTIMNCNLGAMQDEPKSINSSSEIVKTYGTMYQWGRKDPFPPFKSFMTQGGTLYTYSSFVENYYDNSNNQVSFASYERTRNNELFYSLPGKSRPTDFNEAIVQSIQNPTVFLCGMNEAKSYTNEEVGWRTSFDVSTIKSALQNNYPAPHDGNWLYDEDNEHYNRLWGGLDPERDYVGKSYNTGLKDKTDNEIHLFDDYGEKSIFDPCPYGWRVSPPDLWLGFTSTGLNALSYDEMNYDASKSNDNGMTLYLTGWREGESSYFPTSGTRQPNGDCLNAQYCGNYHNATADVSSRVNILHVDMTYDTALKFYFFNIFENRMMTYYIKSTGSSVRCIKLDSVQK